VTSTSELPEFFGPPIRELRSSRASHAPRDHRHPGERSSHAEGGSSCPTPGYRESQAAVEKGWRVRTGISRNYIWFVCLRRNRRVVARNSNFFCFVLRKCRLISLHITHASFGCGRLRSWNYGPTPPTCPTPSTTDPRDSHSLSLSLSMYI
jgi:hypothetical protein